MNPSIAAAEGFELIFNNPTAFVPRWAEAGPTRHEWDSLTEDERRVIILLVHGRTVAQLGPLLAIRSAAVETLITSALSKLGFRAIHNLTEHHATSGFTSCK